VTDHAHCPHWAGGADECCECGRREQADDLRERVAEAVRGAFEYASPGLPERVIDAVMPVIEADQAEYEETVVGSLNQRVIRAEKRAGRAEQVLAAVREYVETSDDDGITAREIVLGLLGGKTIGEVEAGRATRVAATAAGSNERASSVGACPVCRRVPDLGVCPVQHSRQLPAGGHCACACEETPA
jgi:hypothetical protein